MVRQISLASLDVSSLQKTSGHKYGYGHALIFSGGVGRTGAARLAARAALRVGAGLVTIGSPPAALLEVTTQITALMVQKLTSPDAVSTLLEDERINALCLGPGFGLEEVPRAVLMAALATRRPTVLDADALTLLSGTPDVAAPLHPDCVLTPHGGEFARLFPDLSPHPKDDDLTAKTAATRAAAERAGCTVLLKGARTVIAHPDGRCAQHLAVGSEAAPWLATAGSGDVLSGLITGLLARGFDPMTAAELATCLHAECARSFGPGLIAEDLPEELPKVFRRMGF